MKLKKLKAVEEFWSQLPVEPGASADDQGMVWHDTCSDFEQQHEWSCFEKVEGRAGHRCDGNDGIEVIKAWTN